MIGLRTRGAADDDVGVGQLLVEGAQVDGITLEFGRQRLCPTQGAICDDHVLDAGGGKMPCGERDHLSGADHEGGVSIQVRIHAPREAHRRGCERDRIRADLRLGTHTLGGGKGGLKQLIEPRPGAAGLMRNAVGILQLTQNLRFAEHHGVESGGDAEGVLDREAVLMHIQAGGEVQIIAVVPLQPLRQFRAARGPRPVDLGAIAG